MMSLFGASFVAPYAAARSKGGIVRASTASELAHPCGLAQ